MYSYLYYNKSIYFLCFIAGCLYCTALIFSSFFYQNVTTIFFIIFLTFLTYKNITKRNNFSPSLNSFLLQFALIVLGIAISAQVFHAPKSFFWAQDSLLTHLPESLKFSEFINGKFETIALLGRADGKTTHAITGLFISIFGLNTFTTIFVQLIFKIVTSIFIYRICLIQWNQRVGITAATLYSFCPTIFFYNLILYKEGMVQLAVTLITLCTLKIFLNKKYIFIAPLFFSYFILIGERAYLAYTCTASLFLMPLFLSYLKSNTRKALYLTLLISVAFLLVETGQIDVNQKIIKLEELRSYYSSFSDVQNKYNYDIPLPVAFFKILFSPYFTINKFSIFQDTSLLLIWGSFINQIIIMLSIFGLYQACKKSAYHLVLWVPFFIFLFFAAYISPWSGRLRDSFYPLIACYAAHFLHSNKYTQKILKLENK